MRKPYITKNKTIITGYCSKTGDDWIQREDEVIWISSTYRSIDTKINDIYRRLIKFALYTDGEFKTTDWRASVLFDELKSKIRSRESNPKERLEILRTFQTLVTA